LCRFLTIIAVLFPLVAQAETLKVATWNLNWLTLRQAGDRELPDDVTPRQPEDFDRLAQYAAELNPDIVAMEEVDGHAPASRLFPRDNYALLFSRDHVVQRVGIALRRGLHYDINPDLKALSAHHLRSGVDVTVHLGQRDLRILAVHLKKGCREVPLPQANSRACEELRDQLPPLQEWIAARQQEGVPFLILGDFNRWMENGDTFYAGMQQAGPLIRATEGKASPCWGHESFIDHIMAGGPARTWLQTDSLRVMVYKETGKEWRDKLSDHCPLSVTLTIPGG
jgi:endonuclease/exonuclease/phosphatase family metal-dependent hydrolase